MPEDWLSYHSVVQHCPGRAAVEIRRIPIEPLVGFLRNPTFMLKFCASSKSFTHVVRTLFSHLQSLHTRAHSHWSKTDFLATGGATEMDVSLGIASRQVNLNYMFPLWHCERSRRPASRNLLFDAGAGLYRSSQGGGSLRWLVTNYRNQGLAFDRIFAWEAKVHADPFATMPSGVLDAISYYNVPVNSSRGHAFNPLRTLRAIARPDDFVVLKLDIDPNTATEEDLIAQILAK